MQQFSNTSSRLVQAIVRDPGVHSAAIGTAVAVLVAGAKYALGASAT